MKLPISLLALSLGLGLTLPASFDAKAAYTGLQRCRAADGTAIYTDKPCAMFDARVDAISDELGMRLSNEAVVEPTAYADVATDDAQLVAVAGRRSLSDGCARTPTQLAMDIQGAMSLHDVNRLAESWYWVGATQAQATPVMKKLEGLTRGSVVSTQYFDAQLGDGLQQVASARGDIDGRAGILHVGVAGKQAQTLELNVERYAGCYFVRF